MELTDKHHEMIDDILDNFEFERVYEVMVALNWKVATGSYDIGKPFQLQSSIPEIADLRRSARRLLKQVIAENCYSVATGGLQATWHEGVLELQFIVTECRAEETGDKDDH